MICFAELETLNIKTFQVVSHQVVGGSHGQGSVEARRTGLRSCSHTRGLGVHVCWLRRGCGVAEALPEMHRSHSDHVIACLSPPTAPDTLGMESSHPHGTSEASTEGKCRFISRYTSSHFILQTLSCSSHLHAPHSLPPHCLCSCCSCCLARPSTHSFVCTRPCVTPTCHPRLNSSSPPSRNLLGRPGLR